MTPRWFENADQPAGFGGRLFCFPCAGGGAAGFRSLQQALGPGIAVCPAHLPGRDSQMLKPPFRDLTAAVEALAEAIEPYVGEPYALFGHSMGALIAFELARKARHLGMPGPSHLLVAARPAPHFLIPGPTMYQLPDSELIAELRRLKGIPDQMFESTELIQFLLPRLRADLELAETYAYSEDDILACPVSVFGGLTDRIERETLEAWSDQTRGSFALRMIPGGHFFLDDPSLLKAIDADLAASFAQRRLSAA
jgi:medium-chain acyl-[acyl-carrier-protein] hydrolase